MTLNQAMDFRARSLPLTESPSAVAILIVNTHEEMRVLLLKRPTHMRAYAGDWCLPGGKQEPDDRHLEDTLWRELKEETGLSSLHMEGVTRLDDFYNGKGRLVRPYLVRINGEDFAKYFAAQREEVADHVCLPLSHLSNIKEGALEHYVSKRSPAYYLNFEKGAETQTVWGLTASLLAHLHNVIFKTAWTLDHGDHFGIVRKGESDENRGRET